MVISGTQMVRFKGYPSRFVNTSKVRVPYRCIWWLFDVIEVTASYIILWVEKAIPGYIISLIEVYNRVSHSTINGPKHNRDFLVQRDSQNSLDGHLSTLFP